MHNDMLPWAVVAALHQEVAPLVRTSPDNLVIIETGIGNENADRKLRDCLRKQKVAGVFGIGLAGALSDRLQIGDLVVGQKVQGSSLFMPAPGLLKTSKEVQLEGSSIYYGQIVTVDEIIWNAQDKQRLAARIDAEMMGCVDMESWTFARVCEEYGIPCLNVRCISDLVDEDLPLDFNLFRKIDGNLDYLRIAFAALIQPESIRRLWELHSHTRICALQLARFVQKALNAVNKAV